MTLPTFGAPIARVDIDLDDISGIVIAAPAAGDILIYDGVDTWRNRVMSGDIAITAAGVTAIQPGVIVDADISPTAEIQVSKLLDGSARQLLQTDAAGTGVEWTDDIDVPGSLDVTDLATFDAGIIIVAGSLDLNNQGGLLNIGAAGNDFGAGQLDLVGGYIILGANGLTIQTTVGDIGFAPEASFNVLLADADADAFDLNDGTSSYYLINTLIAVSGVVAHTFDNTDIEVANIASASFTQVALTGYVFNVTTDADDITGSFATMLRIGAVTLASDTPSTNYTGLVASVEITPPIAGLNVILDTMAGLRILNGGGGAGTETIQYGIFIDTLTAGGTDIGISMANDLDLRSAGALLNVAAAGNSWTANVLTLAGGSGAQTIEVATTGAGAVSNLTLKIPVSGTGTAQVKLVQGAGSGAADNMQYEVQYDGNAGIFAVRSRDIDGSSTDGNVLQIADGTNDVLFAGGISTDGQAAPTTGIQTALVRLGITGASTGTMEIDGATSGTVIITVAAAAGSWTMTLPTGVAGTGGDQLTDAAGNGVTSWAAVASQRQFKIIVGQLSADEAWSRILRQPTIELWHYDKSKGRGTGDWENVYAGVMADKFPEVMDYKNARFAPASAFGYTVAAFKKVDTVLTTHERRIDELQTEVDRLRALVEV